ncbi:hypothetical protein AB0J72_01390 [Dactylosporangium sp. NPDC049742]|uniref:hypothetical protein n=1 Tax=Dactylosporangium sp. NPDC049742 TaxID=3154737 RepID=UPI0034137DAF
MPIDQHLSDQLHDLVDREPGSPAPTRLLLERGRRRARRRRTATLAGVTAAAVLGVAAGTVALQQSPASGPAVTAQQSAQESAPQGTPQLRLAAAVAASGSTSYAFTITMVAGPETRTARGEFDPAATTGVLRYGDGSEQRLVDGQRFIGDGKGHWKFQNDGRHDSLTFSGLGDDPFPVSGDPAQLLQNLAKVGTVTEASPGVYRFTIPAGPTEGEATVADGKVKKVTYNTPFYGLVDRKLVATVTVEFAGYGKTVTVQKPERWVD